MIAKGVRRSKRYGVEEGSRDLNSEDSQLGRERFRGLESSVLSSCPVFKSSGNFNTGCCRSRSRTAEEGEESLGDEDGRPDGLHEEVRRKK